MEGTSFTYEQAASIMGCTVRNIQRLVTDGWLQGLPGTPGRTRSARVTEKSLHQFIILDRLSHVPARDLSALQKRWKNIERNSRQMAEANRYCIDEGKDITGPSPDPLPAGQGKHNSKPPKRCLNHESAEQHQFSFRWRARQLAPKNEEMQEDLVQEMSLAVLECDQAADFNFLFERATSRAKDYLKYESRRGMLSLDEVQEASDKRAEQRAGLNEYIHELLERGVPQYWIDEVIGYRLEVA